MSDSARDEACVLSPATSASTGVASLLSACVVLAMCAAAWAEPVRGIYSRLSAPICPRGGVLMLPLAAERAGNAWPAALQLTLADHRVITGSLAWIDEAPPSLDRRWTDDSRRLTIRAVLPSDDSARIGTGLALGPYLLARLPLDGDGPIQIGAQSLAAQWREVPGIESLQFASDLPRPQDVPTLEMLPGPDRPDPVSPFEYWRWTLLADRMGMNPPPPWGGEVERMAAEHSAAMWRIGLQRLADQSQRIAEQCRDMLTRTAIDRRQPFATWIADPIQVSALIAPLVDFSLTDADVLSAAVSWLDGQPPLFVWPEIEGGEQVRLGIIVPGSEPLAATLQWRDSSEPPVTIQLQPGVLSQVDIDRMPLPKPIAAGLAPPPEPLQQVLQIEANAKPIEVVFGPRSITARPPGVFFRTLAPPLTLAEIQSGLRRIPDSMYATNVELRKLSGRWEVFFECRRPDPGRAPDDDTMTAMPDELRGLDDLRGLEAATLLLGPAEGAVQAPAGNGPTSEGSVGGVHWLAIPERGHWRLYRGVNDGTLQVHRRSYADRWYCRIVLPDSWLVEMHSRPVLLGFVRSHADSGQLEVGPGATLPWRPAPARASVNLREWDDLPNPQN